MGHDDGSNWGDSYKDWIEGKIKISKKEYEELYTKVERYERAMNKSIMQIDLVYTDESDADSALNYIFKYLKDALKS